MGRRVSTPQEPYPAEISQLTLALVRGTRTACEEWGMSSGAARPGMRSAAWRISLWATLAFACGTLIVFMFLDRFVANDIQRRSDAWLSGEVEVLGDVANRTPDNSLYNTVVGEVAELAAREVPNKLPSRGIR